MTVTVIPVIENEQTETTEDKLPQEFVTTISSLVGTVDDERTDIVGRSWNTKDRLEERKRQLDALSHEAIYMIQIGIRLGGNSVRLDYKQLGLHPDVVTALGAAGATTPTIPIFKELRHLGNKLSGDRKRLQDRFLVYGDPWWFYPEAKAPEVAEAVEGLFETYDHYRKSITDETTYNKGFQDYLETVGGILAKANIPTAKIQPTLKRYASLFPSKERLRDSFRLQILGPIRVPSLAEQAVENAQIQTALAAEAEASVKQKEAIAKQQLNARMMAEVQSTLSQSIGNCRDEIQDLIGNSLTRATSMAEGNITNQMKQGIKRNIERLENLVAFDRNLEELVAATKELAAEASSGTKGTFAAQMEQVQTLLDREFALPTAATGHRSLARMMAD